MGDQEDEHLTTIDVGLLRESRGGQSLVERTAAHTL